MTVEYIYGVPPLAGFDKLFGGWLARENGRVFLIDTGVSAGAGDLVAKLQARGVERLDYVLLSHIHLDHAGGLGQVMAAWPEARVVVHQQGLTHLVHPARLWESTREVMGELAEMYGEPRPADPARLLPHTAVDIPGLTILETPGHAPHHLSFTLGDSLFAGEAGGCPVVEEDRVWTRPATPPRYFPEVTRASIALLAAQPNSTAFFGHSPVALPLRETLARYTEQLRLWMDFLRAPAQRKKNGESADGHLDRLLEALLEVDPDLAPIKELAGADLYRERFFTRNDLAGFVDAIESGRDR